VIGALALLLGALLVAAHGHRALLRLTRSHLVDPQVTMVAWAVTLLSVVVTTIAGVIFLALPGHGGLGALLGRLSSCWAALRHGALPSWEEFSALAGALLLAGIGARLWTVAMRQTKVRRSRREQYRFLVALVTTESRESPRVVWLDHPQPIAFSLAGGSGLIVASKGLRQQLGPLPLAATLEHERAHLRGRHQLLLDVVDATAAALPITPLFRTAPAALRELVELAADDAAVRRFGCAAVGEALRTLITGPDVGNGLAMGSAATARRLIRLDSGREARSGAARSLWCALVGLAATVLPAFLGLGLLLSVACSVN